jgi:acetyl-CoA C-acetyltransferase
VDERHLPVIVGVGEVVGDRGRGPDRAREPMALILDAARAAGRDSGASGEGDDLLAAADAVLAVRTTSWAYDAAAAQVAEHLGARPHHLADTTVGGHWPTRLLERAAARIAGGEDQVTLLVGGEAQAALTALTKAGRDPVADAGWSAVPGGPPAFDPAELGSDRMQAAGVVLPTRVYALFHNALQADRGDTPTHAARRSAELYARLSAVAAANPSAWSPTSRPAEDVATVGPGNRMVCEPYPLAVNAMPVVDQAAAVVVTSAAAARAHGIPEDRWVHVWGGAGATDTADVLDRPSFARSEALTVAFDRALERTGLEPTQLDLVDVYSCFPVVPELVQRHLALPAGSTPSATGGHAAFGGPLSSYSLHAVAAVARRLRDGDEVAAVHANGGYLTHHHVTVLGREAHRDGYVGDPAPVEVPADGAPTVRDAAEVVATAGGGRVEVTVETATVEHGRDGRPALAIVVARTADGERVAATSTPGDADAAAALSLAALPDAITTHVGRTVTLANLDGGAVIVS